MKTLAKLFFITGISLSPALAFSQDADSTGLPGDNFDLQGAMELFKNAATPEAFEKALNTESNHVNNLDLNSDGKIDYVQVTDKTDDKNNHAIILRTAVNSKELQDVAVIVLEKTGESSAQLQIIGNEDLYGEELVMEPFDEVPDKPSTGPSAMMAPMHFVVVNVWSWPCVYYMYRPAYVVYASPWGWEMYPVWWYSWRPYYWHQHHHYAYHYHHMYHVAPGGCNRYQAQNVYRNHRSDSPTVVAKYAAPRANYKASRAQQTQGGTKAVQQPNQHQPRTAVKQTDGQKPSVAPQERKTSGQSGTVNQPVRNQQSQPVNNNGNQRTNRTAAPAQQHPRTASPPNSQPQRTVSPAPQRRAAPAPQRSGNPGMSRGGGQRR